MVPNEEYDGTQPDASDRLGRQAGIEWPRSTQLDRTAMQIPNDGFGAILRIRGSPEDGRSADESGHLLVRSLSL
jgi:hypothetical protein